MVVQKWEHQQQNFTKLDWSITVSLDILHTNQKFWCLNWHKILSSFTANGLLKFPTKIWFVSAKFCSAYFYAWAKSYWNMEAQLVCLIAILVVSLLFWKTIQCRADFRHQKLNQIFVLSHYSNFFVLFWKIECRNLC